MGAEAPRAAPPPGAAEIEEAVRLYREIGDLLDEIGAAVMQADTERLQELVPREEELLQRAAAVRLPEGAPAERARELDQLAQEALKRNTRNGVLLQEQLALIKVTMQAILGQGSAVNRLA